MGPRLELLNFTMTLEVSSSLSMLSVLSVDDSFSLLVLSLDLFDSLEIVFFYFEDFLDFFFLWSFLDLLIFGVFVSNDVTLN